MAKIVSNIFLEDSVAKELSEFIRSQTDVLWFVITDENCAKHCYPWLSHLLPKHELIQIKSGEKNKDLQACELIWKKLTEGNADRKSIVINLGGGMVTDTGGFAAGCYKRGIKFVNVPTTLLAMVDASVGGKTGIDFMGFKNQVGLFRDPESVFIYTDFLRTLPEREITSGFAEVIKHYLIADKNEFKELATTHPPFVAMNWDNIILKNVKIKAAVVEGDPEEQNIRKSLNFGHTVGHGVESYFLKDEKHYLFHGEAVAVGMITESFISFKKALISENELKAISTTLLYYFKLPAVPKEAIKEVLNLMKHDKKNVNQQFRFTLLNGIGNYSINNDVEETIITESIEYYNTLLNESH